MSLHFGQKRQQAPIWMVTLAVLALVASGCSDEDGTAGAGAGGASPGGQAFKQVTIANCGNTTTYDAPPERAVPVDQNVTEFMLALGLADRIAGYARVHFDPSEPVLPEYAEAYGKLNLLAESSPSREILLEADPDFAFAAFGFDEDSGLTQDGLEADGVRTYLLPDQCEGRTEPASFADLYATTRDLGLIFGVPDRAEALISEWTAKIEKVADRVEGKEPVSVFIYDSGEDAPFTAGGIGPANAIIEAAGGVNLFGNEDKQFLTTSWEEVLGRDPDVVIIMDYFHGDDGQDNLSKRKSLEARAAQTAAFRDGRVVDMALTGWFLSVRNADTVATLAGVLHP